MTQPLPATPGREGAESAASRRRRGGGVHDGRLVWGRRPSVVLTWSVLLWWALMAYN